MHPGDCFSYLLNSHPISHEKKKKKFNYERDGGRYHIETSPLDWVLYDNGLRHERVNETE